MAHAIAGLDHVLVGADDLDACAETWARLGFTLTPPGRHLGRQTGNTCIMFARDYVELLGIVDPGQPESENVRILRRMGEGLIAAALATTDAAATHAGFAAAGLDPPAVADLTRIVERPDGPAETRFKLVQLAPERTPEFRLFVCGHETPELIRHPDWLAHANGATGLSSLTVAVAAPEALQPALAAVFGAASLTVTDEMLTVFVGAHRLLYVRPEDLAALYPDTEAPAGPAVAKGAAVSFQVADIDATADYLEAAGVAFEEPFPGHLHVPPAEAGNVIVEFKAG
ncbi:MAG: VOC family protein [Thiotrichales bacterium]|nr:VOC family protein [Thiotrichales bacterium]